MENREITCAIPKLVFQNFVFTKVLKDDDSETKKSNHKQEQYESLQKQAKRMNYMKEKGKEDDVQSRMISQGYANAFNRLTGVKVRDDMKLLGQTLHRSKKKKEKSKLVWDERLEKMEMAQMTRQERRMANIKAARDKVLEKKIAKRQGLKVPKSKKTDSKSKKSDSHSKRPDSKFKSTNTKPDGKSQFKRK